MKQKRAVSGNNLQKGKDFGLPAEKEGSEEKAEDLINYKGIYFEDNNEKYIDEVTGCHFRYDDLYKRLLIAKVERNHIDKELKISYTSNKNARETVDHP